MYHPIWITFYISFSLINRLLTIPYARYTPLGSKLAQRPSLTGTPMRQMNDVHYTPFQASRCY